MNNSGLVILLISRIKTRCNRHLGASSTSLCCENAVSDLKTKPPTSDLYEINFYVWTQEQARLLREHRWADLDLENLIDEVAGVGRSDKRQIESRLEVLIAHLFKWKYQPGRHGNSWLSTITERRNRLIGLIEESTSPREFLHREVFDNYTAARLLATRETGIAFGLFPEECPFTPDQVLDLDFFPEDRSIE
jgi:hypothetical protein